jgi:hypothetical protein
MLTERVKVVTIITVFEARELVREGFAGLGVVGYSSSHVDGVGAHGEKRSGFTGVKNLEYVVVTSEALAARLLDWVEHKLLPHHPSIAYSTAAAAVTAAPLR